MSTLDNIKTAFRALKVGEQLANSATWKDKQALAAQVVVMLSIILPILRHFGFDLKLDGDETYQVGMALAAVGYGAFNWYLTLATSRIVGVDEPKPPTDYEQHA